MTRDRGVPIPPPIRKLAFRYHLYWAGSDEDGTVVGFYWAATETIPTPVEGTGLPPPLPGPRTRDYHYTTRTDSTFTFNVSEFSPDRQHAFFIYAVDDKGKVDPTPARFIFYAFDRYPPLPTLDVSVATGPVAHVYSPGVPTVVETTITIRDTVNLARRGYPPLDTIASGSRVDFHWHNVPTLDRNPAVRYKYKLEEPVFCEVDTSIQSESYGTGLDYRGQCGTRPSPDVLGPGTKVFTLRAIDGAGGARDITRFFQVNRNPDTWFAGPDSNLVPIVPNSGRQRYITVPNWRIPPSFPGSGLSCDSLFLWPSERKPSKTFWEIYKDRLYLHVENDTVNTNGWVLFWSGGCDNDSPYAVQVNSNDPIADTVTCAAGRVPRVIRPTGPVGSPTAFRYQYAIRKDPDLTSFSTPTQSGLYPLFDAASSTRLPLINGYGVFSSSGRVYLLVHAYDGDGSFDESIPDAFHAMQLTDAVENPFNPDTDPVHVALRKTRVLTFFVNRSPYFNYENANFFPKPPAYNNPPGTVASSPDRKLRLSLIATDPDPFEPATRPTSGGGPSTGIVLRTRVKVIGSNAAGNDTSYTAPNSFTTQQTIDLAADAPYITGTDLKLDIQLCDCANCENDAGSGRCIHTDPPIPVTVPAATASATSPGPPAGGARASTRSSTSSSTRSPNRPGGSLSP